MRPRFSRAKCHADLVARLPLYVTTNCLSLCSFSRGGVPNPRMKFAAQQGRVLDLSHSRNGALVRFCSVPSVLSVDSV